MEGFKENESCGKAKGVPQHIVKRLKREHFAMPGKGFSYNNVSLGPTAAGQMGLTVRSRNMAGFLNTKRRVHAVRTTFVGLNVSALIKRVF